MAVNVNDILATLRVCPHCGGDPGIIQGQLNNCLRFFAEPVIRARCCGYGIKLVPTVTVQAVAMPKDTHVGSLGEPLEFHKEPKR
jgi:hypothetical protein